VSIFFRASESMSVPVPVAPAAAAPASGPAPGDLFQYVALDKVWALNEAIQGSCQKVIQPLGQPDPPADCALTSSTDEELLVMVPFKEVVKLQAIALVGGPNESAPSKLRVFLNRNEWDFELARGSVPNQEWPFDRPVGDGVLWTECAVNGADSRFGTVSGVALHFPASCGAPTTTVLSLSFRGETTGMTTEPLVAHTLHEGTASFAEEGPPHSQAPDISSQGGGGP